MRIVEYEWTDDMGEITGLGGALEEACRRMLFAGLAWFDSHPKARPAFRGGLDALEPLNEDADDLWKVFDAIGAKDATGFALPALLYIRRNGWRRYQDLMRQNQEARSDGEVETA